MVAIEPGIVTTNVDPVVTSFSIVLVLSSTSLNGFAEINTIGCKVFKVTSIGISTATAYE